MARLTSSKQAMAMNNRHTTMRLAILCALARDALASCPFAQFRGATGGNPHVLNPESVNFLQEGAEVELGARATANKVTKVTDGVALTEYQLSHLDFKAGTLRIDKPGRYVLTTDVEFGPDYDFPSTGSELHPLRDGYFLGWFAAVAIEGDNIEFDCAGYTIKQSARHHRLQRFFSVIELASKPFLVGAGPPQFSNSMGSNQPLRPATNTIIRNCKIGLSSHHGIHGNANNGIQILNTDIFDFEVGGIALNGPSNIHIENAHIGPSLTRTFNAKLSQAIFNVRQSEIGRENPKVDAIYNNLEVDIKGVKKKASVYIDLLRDSVYRIINHDDIRQEDADLFGSNLDAQGTRLPDGSAMYGIHIGKKGPAVADFAACSEDTKLLNMDANTNIHIKDVHIHDLLLAPELWVSFKFADGQVQSCGGDVFQVDTHQYAGGKLKYTGTVLSDAQVMFGPLCKEVRSTSMSSYDKFAACGGASMPQEVCDWAMGGDASEALVAATVCTGDAMSHHNKGVVGLRAEFLTNLDVHDVNIDHLANYGSSQAHALCPVVDDAYKGADVRLMAVSYVQDLAMSSVSLGLQSSYSTNQGAVMGVDSSNCKLGVEDAGEHSICLDSNAGGSTYASGEFVDGITTPVHATSVDSCQMLCTFHSDCVAITWALNSCYLFKKVQGEVYWPGMTDSVSRR